MPYPLEGYFQQINNLKPVDHKTANVDLNHFNRNALKEAIPHIDQMDEHTLSVLIKNNIDVFTKDILTGDVEYAHVLTNPKFINSFIRAINSVPIDHTIQLACNRITYDYFTSEKPDIVIKQQYLNISRVVNREAINKLISIGLDENTASNLALCRYSSPNEKTNVKRLNFAIYHRDPSIMTEQMVIWIYEKLFSRISDLFQATMFEVYNEQQQIDFGENFMENYGTVGLAILIILNNMTTENIKKVLIGYEAEWEYHGYPAVRYSLRALSADYSRIARVVDYLTSVGKNIP